MGRRNKRQSAMWFPRVLAMVLISFFAIFSFNFFSANNPLAQNLMGLIIHILPALMLSVSLIISVKYPKTGGIGFILVSICFTFFFKTYDGLGPFLIISCTTATIGILFIVLSTGNGNRSRYKR